MNTPIRYSFVMLTCDRSPKPNYITQTLESLSNSILPGNCSLLIYQNGQRSSEEYRRYLSYVKAQPKIGESNLSLIEPPYIDAAGVNHHVAEAVRMAVELYTHNANDWLIFLEDDLIFCADFFNSIRRWLDHNATNDRRLYSFGCPYPQADKPRTLLNLPGVDCWSYYPTESFYGTQCFAVRSIDAMIISDYLSGPQYLAKFAPGQYDLGIAHILSQSYPSIGYFAASRPSFVQHVGIESSIRPDGPYFTFPSFPGIEWSYKP